jgi:hypothetical protein
VKTAGKKSAKLSKKEIAKEDRMKDINEVSQSLLVKRAVQEEGITHASPVLASKEALPKPTKKGSF